MATFFLCMIYAAFISLGLPDSLLGAAWPAMQPALGVPLDSAGVLSMIVAGGTVVASLSADRMLHRFGTGRVTLVSVTMTACALLGYALAPGFWWLALAAVPMGLGAGAVDAGLNNFVALHYEARHMSWLHCFWGVGAAVSPYIMGYSLTGGYGWNSGYRAVSIVQLILTAALFISLPLWKRKDLEKTQEEAPPAPLSLSQAVKIKGVPLILVTFFAYCALEQTTGLWASSYLVQARNIHADTAAGFASLFFLGITFGRFLCGFFAEKLGDKLLIRIGIFAAIAGAGLIGLPVPFDGLALAGLIVIGLGCAPIYPSIIHSTPFNFGRENSQSIIGIQMACAYVGTTLMPPLFGWLASGIGIGLYPFYLLFFAVLMLVMSERLNRTVNRPMQREDQRESEFAPADDA